MKISKSMEQLKLILPIVFGTAIYAFGLLYFIIPSKLMEGGITGITLLLNYAFSISPSLSTLFLNIPLFLIGWKMLGGKQIIYTGVGIGSLTFFLWLFEKMIHSGWMGTFQTEHDFILSSLYAGVTLGAGLGIVFRFGGTTGGSDIIARILNRKFGWSMGRIMLVIDIVIIGASLLYIPKEKILYTLVAVFIASKIIDFIQEGAYSARAFMIISDHTMDIADIITKDMDRGVTIIPAVGAFSKQAKHVAYCVVSRQEIRRLHQIVKAVDPRAFIIIQDVHDVHGEGFKEE
ncbi:MULTISPECIES: YitT family protein [Paenibacillus]|uniref:YitT family protein n=1 Tax=Paenibacillus TaxID=44249 RepID=UPI00058A150E|nr:MULTISPECIES: YitT family protein [Paenibacillus]AJE53584.1 membrane protein [Paenibacillus polymyxa]AZH29951.1 YitT family protein [Paenibacillus sp. M-152]QOH62567.1 YitT family protein [Paenibacillus polymyxa]